MCSPACDENAICSERWGSSRCQVGFFPGVFECSEEEMTMRINVECSSDAECALPASCVSIQDGSGVCGFRCSSSADCPWDAECMNGTCVVTGPYWSHEQAYYCEGGNGCSDDKWCLNIYDFFLGEKFYCVDEDPCYSHSDCTGDLQCMGICTRNCLLPDSADVCPDGFQCVSNADAPEGVCLPPVCECPDTGGPKTACEADTGRCFFPQTCAPAVCDGTYGPLVDPGDPDAGTCCQDGNPCGLNQEEICQCPPACDFWTAHYCCHHEDICPSEDNPASLCPEGYECQLTDHGDSVMQAYGFFCVTGSQ